MRVFSILITVAVMLFSTPKEYLLVSTKQFTVQGTTSIGGFECTYDLNTKDTLFFNDDNQKSKIAHSIPVREFGCGNFILNADFRKTLNANEYPTITVELTNFKKQNEYYSCDLSLQLVGIKKSYKNLKLKMYKNRIDGDVIVNFSDFGLKPPKKVGGMIKISEKIKISISLNTV
jgi:polyisoprenoid-binding protein YceI